MPPKHERIQYLGKNVYEAAKDRIKFLIPTVDHLVVSFSGGKDSLAVLELVREVYKEMGITKKIKVVFRDEELIPDDVINMVTDYYNDPQIDMKYFAFPQKSRMFIMGETIPYVQWDESRKWIREKPDFAITQIHPENVPLSQHETNPLIYKGVCGIIAVLNGIRADESMTRFNASMAVKGEFNWINRDAAKNVLFCKPIFDWTETDLFKYFYEKNIRYCAIYDKEMWAQAPLRVSTPLHAQSFSYLTRLREMYPVFFDQICSIFPQVTAHERYWKEYDLFGAIGDYEKSFDGMRAYVNERIDNPKSRSIALDAITQAQTQKQSNKMAGRYPKGECWGFPLLYVFKKIISGDYMYGMAPTDTPSPSMIEFERQAEEEAEDAMRGR